ncbi:hypothetical protein BHE74_00059215 [Ensete ventricosum]|nr:hypothetical protein BHE74_00059215 [Ensete ventricosum]
MRMTTTTIVDDRASPLRVGAAAFTSGRPLPVWPPSMGRRTVAAYARLVAARIRCFAAVLSQLLSSYNSVAIVVVVPSDAI